MGTIKLHKALYRETRKGFPFGNGCPLHKDCFTCPAKDCEYDPSLRRWRANKSIGKEVS